MKKLLLLLFCFCFFSFADTDWAHQDFYVIKDYDNIKTRIKTGFEYEEIRKVELIGQYAKSLAKKRNYKKPIFLDFSHFYVGDCDPDYFISFGNGRVRYKHDTERKPPLSSDGIVIRQVSRKFDIFETLHLLDYAISNRQEIKSKQRLMKYVKNYEDNIITSIDTVFVNTILKREKSEWIQKVLDKKIWRLSKKEKKIFSQPKYYSQNNKYYVQYHENKKLKQFVLNNVYDFQVVDKNSALLFDTPSSFYYLYGNIHKGIPKKTIIKNLGDYYKPFNVQKIGRDKISIYIYSGFGAEQRTLIYDIKSKKIIQDLDQEFQD